MVKITKSTQLTRNSAVTGMIRLTSLALCAAAMLVWTQSDVDYSGSSLLATDVDLKHWRQSVTKACESAKTKEDVEAIRSMQTSAFTLPLLRSSSGRTPIKPCKNVLLDFGANIGDTSGKLVDAGLQGCSRKDLSADVPEVSFDVESKSFTHRRHNALTGGFKKLLGEDGPEDYCYYGVEGNPVFTERLADLEATLSAIRPSPLEHLHFFTESVGAGKDGPTKLYLDTVNGKQNYWGSSIFSGHQDVVKSSEGKTEKVAADVMGYTIGTLMKQTLRALQPDATEAEKKGNKFILKVDIEGGEFPLLAEAAEEGTLCRFVAMGNQADLFIEYHSQRVTGPNEWAGKKKEFTKKLEDCGVQFRQLGAHWH